MIIYAVGHVRESEFETMKTILGSRHVAADLRSVRMNDEANMAPIGRESIGHLARERAVRAHKMIGNAKMCFGISAGIEMTPTGSYLVCAVTVRAGTGREATGWSLPRLLPETVVRGVSDGGGFDSVLEEFRKLWHPTDVFTATDLDELLSRHHSIMEAAGAAFDALENGGS